MNILTRSTPTHPAVAPNTALTPNRQTLVTFDLTEQVLVNGATAMRRAGQQIAPVAGRDKGADSAFSQGMRLWSPGFWSLRPIQDDFARMQEKALPALTPACIFQPDVTPGTTTAGMNCVGASLRRFSSFTPTTGIGLAASASVNTGSDPFYQKSVAAGASFAQVVGVSADVSALQPAIETDLGTHLTQSLDPLLVVTDTQAANQGFCLRWFLPGHGLSTYDVVGSVHFGQYALVLYGNGDASLWEYARPVGNPSLPYAWGKRKTFQYCRANQVTGCHHAIVIYPVQGPNGEKMVCFTGAHLIASESGSGGLATTPNATRAAGHTTQHETYHKFDSVVDGGADESPGFATKAGRATVQWRRDLRPKFQLSQLLFQQIGLLADQPAYVGVQTGAARTYTVQMTQRVPATCSLTAAINDTITQSSTGTITRPYVVFTFSGNGGTSPNLWDYTLTQPEAVQVVTPGAFTANVTSCDLSGPDGDPRHERGSVTINDPSDQESRLRTRGELSARVHVNYTIPGTTTQAAVVLFRGYALRPRRLKHGKTGMADGSNGLSVRAYPSPEWSEYGVTLVGMWERLTEVTSRTASSWQVFARDETAPNDPVTGNKPPWKVTEVIKRLISVAGFPVGMVNIPDNPIRLSPGFASGGDDTILNVSTNIAEQLIVLVRGYLGQFLYFDANAGAIQADGMPIGQWTLLVQPDAGATPVFNFVTTPASTTRIRLPWGAGGLPANTSITLAHLESYVVAPEANHLVLFTMDRSSRVGNGMLIGQHLFNAKSYNAPGFTNAVDVTSPHYFGGREKLLMKVDLSLWGGDGPDGLRLTQQVIDFVIRRYYNFACLARRIQPLYAPLAFILDASTGRYRGLRFLDPVTFNGVAYYVRSASPRYTSDRVQTCDYELERIEP